jgi:release factor glutamine methyltransferase
VPDDPAARLAAAGCVAPAAEAAELVGAAPDTDTLEHWLRRRERGEPLAWITGSVVFAGRRIRAAPGVYVPRRQTEELARRAAARLPDHGVAVDLCTGCGAVAAHLSAAVPSATVLGADVDRRAAVCARVNGVVAVVADLDAAFRASGRVDVVTAVAPYVPTVELAHLPRDVTEHEPRLALDGGSDGLDVVRRVVAAAARLLRPGGSLLVELGGEQDVALAPALAAAGFADVEPWHDDDGDLRGLAARRARGRGAYSAGTGLGSPSIAKS